MNDVMIDLETMGCPPRAVIAAVGAVYFDRMTGAIGGRFYRAVSLASGAGFGLEFDGDTITWWLGQSDEARKAVSEGGASLPEMLRAFASFLGPPSTRETLRFWGNGPTFDLTILRSAHVAAGYPEPWHHRQERCVRTIVGLDRDAFGGGDDDPTARYEGATDTHHALHDALAQALYVSAMYQRLATRPVAS